MRITGADHTNWRIRDLEATLGFYRDVLGFEPFGIEEYERGERPLVSVRVTENFILHFVPDVEFEGAKESGYDHLALVVEETSLEDLVAYFGDRGIAVERTFESIIGAKGEGPALYVRDPDGYRIELKMYR